MKPLWLSMEDIEEYEREMINTSGEVNDPHDVKKRLTNIIPDQSVKRFWWYKGWIFERIRSRRT